MAITIKEEIIPISKARPGKKLNTNKPVLIIHNTGNTGKGAGARNHQKYLYNNRDKISNGFHWVVDDTGEAIHLIPDDEYTAQCGSTTWNNKSTSIEICENSDGDLLKSTNNGAELAAYILKKLGYTKAVSKENIFQHNFVATNKKNCPSRIRAGQPYDWDTFVKKVNEFMGNTTITTTPSTSTTSGTPIMGTSKATLEQMCNMLVKNGWDDKWYNGLKGDDFCHKYVSIANSEGVRPDVAFAQMLVETGNLKFGNLVVREQNNFAGLGASGAVVEKSKQKKNHRYTSDNKDAGLVFNSVDDGIRAQVQHLRAYASKDALKTTSPANYDRFGYVERGCAPTVEELSGKWASSKTYGDSIKKVLNEMLSSSSSSSNTTTTPSTNTNPTRTLAKILVSDLNYRSTPSMSGKILGQLPQGLVRVDKTQGGWGYNNEYKGWFVINNPKYVKTANEFLIQSKVVTLNIRSGPGTNYKVNGQLKNDKNKYYATDVENGFYKLKSGAGWLFGNYCKVI